MENFERKRYGWVLELGEVDYERIHRWQRGLVTMRREGLARDTIILVEHPPVITVGKDGHPEHFANLEVQPIFVERGGDVTYHGPGQLVVYFIFDLTRRGRDLHRFIRDVQEGIIRTLQVWGISARRDREHTGVWVEDKKIASLGIAVKQWVTFHGVAINLNTALEEFRKINPCGLEPAVMTSVRQLTGKSVDRKVFGARLVEAYKDIFQTEFTPIALEEIAEELESQAGGYTI